MNKIIKMIALAGISTMLLTTAAASLKKQKTDKKEADVVLTDKNSVALYSQVDSGSVGELIKALRKLDTDDQVGDPIYLILYTPGGSIQAGIELIEAVKGLRRPVRTITIFAASMGFQIAQNLDDRLILNGGTLMSHKARGGAEGEFGPNNDSQLDKRLNFWKLRLLEMDKKTVERTNGKQTLQSYQSSYENELWMTGNQAVQEGYADKVVSVRCDNSLNKGTNNKTVNAFGMVITIKFSKCPLQTSPEEVEEQIKTNKGNMTVENFTSQGGILGVDCTVAKSRIVNDNGQVLCAIDSSLTKEKIIEIRRKVIYSHTVEGMKEQIGYTW